MAAAVSCYAQYGYAATRIRVIADRAGVSEAALYRHFPSAEGLAAEVYVRHFSRYSQRLTDAIAGSRAAPQEETQRDRADRRTGDAGDTDEAGRAIGPNDVGISPTAESQLRAVARATFEMHREDPDAFIFALEVLPMFLSRLPAGFAFPLEQVEAVIAAGQHSGGIRPGQVNVLASVFMGALLRPIQLTTLAAAGTLNLDDADLVALIEDAAIAALRGGPH